MAKKNSPELEYELNIDSQRESINKKIQNLENKLISLNNKESIINTLIIKINNELENIDPKHFKAVSQMRTTLNKQFETLGLITDMIAKYEDMIQKYRKMLIDIENQKINNIIKFQNMIKGAESAENDAAKILLQINERLNSMNENGSKEDQANPFYAEVIQELEDKGDL